jgi:hypothetical protein
MLGLLADHAIGLATGSMTAQAVAAWVGIAALIGAGVLAWRERAAPTAAGLAGAGLVIIVVVLLALAAYAQPLLEWDARSIWFFHAKAVYFDHGLHPGPFWQNRAYDWSQKDYPELVPMLAARFASFAGGWNEFAPKGALVVMAASGFAGLLAICGSLAEFAVLAVGAVALLGYTLWNGYMDGWLAGHACVAVGAAARWSSRESQGDALLCAAALGVCLCLKNEGALVVLITLPVLAPGLLQRRGRIASRELTVAVALLPFLLWVWRKHQIAPPSYLQGGSLIKRAFGVMSDWHELMFRLGYLARASAPHSVFPQALGAFIVVAACVGLSRAAALRVSAALLYAAGLVGVYLGTPADFVWHVGTSFDRVILVPSLLALAAVAAEVPAIIAACLGRVPSSTTASA